jgi:hypothetical protein
MNSLVAFRLNHHIVSWLHCLAHSVGSLVGLSQPLPRFDDNIAMLSPQTHARVYCPTLLFLLPTISLTGIPSSTHTLLVNIIDGSLTCLRQHTHTHTHTHTHICFSTPLTASGTARGFGVVSYFLIPSGTFSDALFIINASTGRIVTNASVCNVTEDITLIVEAADQVRQLTHFTLCI